MWRRKSDLDVMAEWEDDAFFKVPQQLIFKQPMKVVWSSATIQKAL